MGPTHLLFFIAAAIFVVSAKKQPLVTEFVKKTGESPFGKEWQYYGVLIESKESDDYDDFFDEFEKAAKKFEGKVKFVYINTDVEENWKVIEYLGLIAEDVPTVLFIELNKGLVKYKAPFTEITKANIISFTDDCVNGKAESFMKSEDLPEDWDSKPVKYLVSKNFEEAVFNSKKTSFVFFYAPWCQACQNTMPEIEKLGKLFAKKKNVMIAKMDSTVNEVPRIPILDVPTIALFLNGDRKPIYHTADERTVDAFSKFITEKMKEGKKAVEEENESEVKEEKEEEEEVVDKKEKKSPKKEEEVADKKEKKSTKKEEKDPRKDSKTGVDESKKESKSTTGKGKAKKSGGSSKDEL